MAQSNLPYNLEAEKSVLGCALIDNETVNTIFDGLVAQDFYDRRHQIIYTAMIALNHEQTAIDVTTLLAELQMKGQLEEAGGSIYLAELIESVYTTANIEDYVHVVQDASMKRHVMAAADSISKAATDSNYSSTDYLDYAEKIIMELSKKRKSDELVPASEVVEAVDQLILLRRSAGTDIVGLTTGYPRLDAATLGLQKGNLIILAARPAMGKSAFAMNLALNAARTGKSKEGGKANIALFSLEMSKEQIAQRMLAALSRVDLGKIQKGDLTQKELMLVQSSYQDLADMNIYFSDQSAITVADIRAKCRKQKTNVGLDLIIIDYMQLINSASKGTNRQEEISVISRTLKQMARELDVPVIALAQLSREVEKREDKRPGMADLRESGSIEQDADMVMFLYRDDYYHKGQSETPGVAELLLAKNRNGQSGSDVDIKFVFQGNFQLFTPYEGN